MNKHPATPKGWASRISTILKARDGEDRFPVNVIAIAQDYSRQIFPDEPIVAIRGENLPGFEGALFRMPAGKKGWAIFYNNNISSQGRINFTLAHEFGHYLIHRLDHPNGIQCNAQDSVKWDSEYNLREQEADTFAANLLMPFDDFRSQIPATSKVDFDMLSHCTDRYGVSLIAAILQWLQYTAKRAVLVVSRDGFILWSRSSEPALKTGRFFKTSQGVIEIPVTSLPLNTDLLQENRASVTHPSGVWFPEEVQEMTILADRYDFAISLLLLDDVPTFDLLDEEFETESFEQRLEVRR
jgi:hypothetical protein